ncbi:MAG: prolyl oligopeptidase family serine peptidase, partial [Polyangiaceae bacterium]
MNVLKHLAVLLLLGLPSSSPLQAAAPPNELRLAPAKNGSLGAWLLIGPYHSATYGVRPAPSGPEALTQPPPGVNEPTIVPHFGAVWGPPPNDKIKESPRWIIASSGEGPIDIRAALQSRESDLVAYAGATLHVEHAGHFFLLIGADDGLRVIVDGKPIFTRDESRPERDDDDLVPLDLTAGDHSIVLKLHQRDAGWALHVRLVDAALEPPVGAYLALPGTHLDDARVLAAKMSWVSVDRGMKPDHYGPKLTVRFPEGVPLNIPLAVRAKLVSAKGDVYFEVNAGGIAAEQGEMVATLPVVDQADLPRVEDQSWTYELTVAERIVKAPFYPRRVVREAVARADRALPQLQASPAPAWLAHGSLESVTRLRDRLVNLTTHGDGDIESEILEAAELNQAAASLEKKTDPYLGKTGPLRRAYRSPADGELAEYGLYVPPEYKRGAGVKYPLIVALHGLNGKPMAMLRWFFGADDPKKDQDWEDRHLGVLPPLEAFVVTPNGHGNTMYRQLGQDDVMRALDDVMARYPIDATRVTVTGPSMGGIGAAAVAFRFPDRFAAAAPLCGYHSLFVRGDVKGKALRPWERFLGEERSNVAWASNGRDLPLMVVHGTQDLPVENSGALID